MACALGMVTSRNFLSARYARLPDLLTELAIARGGWLLPQGHEAVQAGKRDNS